MKRIKQELGPFISLLRPHFRRMGLGTLLGWLAVLASVGLLGLSGWFISATAFAGLTVATATMFNFYFPSGGVRIFAITRTLARYAERLVCHDATFRMLATLRVWFYTKIEPLTPARLMPYRKADILNRIVSDIDALDNLYVRVLSPSVVAALSVIAVVIFLAFFDMGIALTALMFLLIAALAIPLAAAKVGATAGRRLTRHTVGIRTRVIEAVQGLSELQVFGAWHSHLDLLWQESSDLIRVQRRMSNIRGLSSAAITLLTGLAVLACLYIGVDRVAQGMLDGANLAVVGLAVLVSFEALLPLPWAYQFLGQTRQAGKRLLELVQTAPQVVFAEESSTAIKQYDIHFDRVDFRYRTTDPWVLKAFDLHIDSGRRVAVLGPTGVGKSTLLNLLVRFWDPQHGRICIGGQDIKKFAESDLRLMIGVVTQHAHLFNASIRENLSMARPDADDEALCTALQLAQILDFVKSLPNDLDTWIGEGGRSLSGGQARRLCLARLFLQDAPMWILDEPTEGLDLIAEQHVMQALYEASAGRSMLLITHKATGLQYFDEILMLDRSGIVANGPHDLLIKENRRYVELLRIGESLHA